MTITVGPTRQKVLEDGRHRTRTRVTFGDGTERVLTFVTSSDVPFVETNRGDLWLAPALVVAMRRREDLVLADPISERSGELQTLQDILAVWYPRRMGRVSITAPAPDPEPRPRPWRSAPEKVTGSFFTGGVDSFYTLVKNRERVKAIVYGFGLDVPLKEKDAIERVAGLLEDVSRESGTRLLTARTNVRPFVMEDARWGTEAHGAALVSLATLFSPVLDRILLPASHSYRAGFPWGTHPLLDRHWSTPRLPVEHDGAEAGRSGKVQRVSEDPVAQRHLRVCYTRFDSMNCCRCLKCLRTMANLEVLGRLDDFDTFPEPLDLERLASFELKNSNAVNQVKDLLGFVRRGPGHDEIEQTLTGMLRRAGALKV